MNNFIPRDTTITILENIKKKLKAGTAPSIEEYAWIVYVLDKYIHILGKRKEYRNNQKSKKEIDFQQRLLQQIGMFKQQNELVNEEPEQTDQEQTDQEQTDQE